MEARTLPAPPDGAPPVAPALDPVPIEVLGPDGRWWPGFLLLHFRSDGRVTVRSVRTGAVRQLPPDQWRDPVEVALLANG